MSESYLIRTHSPPLAAAGGGALSQPDLETLCRVGTRRLHSKSCLSLRAQVQVYSGAVRAGWEGEKVQGEKKKKLEKWSMMGPSRKGRGYSRGVFVDRKQEVAASL